jgi:hypothetical protein
MADKQLLISVAHSLKEPWLTIFREGSQNTWLQSPLPSEFKLVHFHGLKLSNFWNIWDAIHEKVRWKNRWVAAPLRWFDLLVAFPFLNLIPSVKPSSALENTNPCFEINCKDTYQFLRWKDLAILKYFIENTRADYIFMTTNNSYVDFVELSHLVDSFPADSFYGGVVPYNGANFAAGNNRFLSRDVAELILRNRREFSAGDIEDVALGKIATDLGFSFQPLKSLVLQSLQELESTSDEELLDNFHFRVKSGPLTSRNDVSIMLKLHSRLNGLRAI